MMSPRSACSDEKAGDNKEHYKGRRDVRQERRQPNATFPRRDTRHWLWLSSFTTLREHIMSQRQTLFILLSCVGENWKMQTQHLLLST